MKTKENKEPNKLIIIGNGFDLAHGLETGYEHFMLWVINTEIESLKINYKSKYGILELSNDSKEDSLNSCDRFTSIAQFKFFLDSDYPYHLPENPKWMHHIIFKNYLFQHLIFTYFECNWVNIESEFYNQLVENFEADIVKISNRKRSNQIETFYGAFEEIKSLLITYLKKINTNSHNQMIQTLLFDINKVFVKQNNDAEIIEKKLKPILLLNFNYTATPDKYYNYLGSNLVDLIYIHGNLIDINNPIIFGYGDDSDNKYKEIEQCGHNEYLDYIKDFEYLKTQNYLNMENFVEGGKFEVYIMGHSCGKSDRTLLKFIFQHKNCKKIYIKYKDEQDYFDKTKEIARAFDNKIVFRKKVASIKNPKVGPLVG